MIDITSTTVTDGAYLLLQKAAEMGPGYRGRKREASQAERENLASVFREQGESPPPYFDIDSQWIERRAKLFESGDYPDKGVTITQRDLERMAANFDLPVPVWIEHAESPLELGYLTEVAVEDGELFGLLALTQEANALIERSGAKSLSIGLSADLAQIREVSLVRFPRVASAQLFNDSILFESKIEFGIDWRAKYEEAMVIQRTHMAQEQIKKWIAKGQITPAQAPYATALLSQESGIEFNGGLIPIRDLVSKLIASQAQHGMFGEHAPQPIEDTSSVLMLPEEAAFYRKHFPDVSLEAIAQKRASRFS
ncbi:MAG: hypothetical protein H7Y17_06740 [Chlorobia bacterium]|nr:hypothetical protein [Fimbriimonadaceae bacterium]